MAVHADLEREASLAPLDHDMAAVQALPSRELVDGHLVPAETPHLTRHPSRDVCADQLLRLALRERPVGMARRTPA